jgi:bacterial/archaeal transporter family-2 protein
MFWLFLFFAFLAGFLFPLQTGINAQLRQWVGHPLLAALVSFGVGTLFLSLCPPTLGITFPSWSVVKSVPWWAWIGGLLGSISVASSIILAPRMGAAAFIATIVAGQMAASLLLDHLGALGFRFQPITPWRLIGAGLLIGGVWLIQRN